jgi:hypothetical protein
MKKYRPSNGQEGEWFMEDYCYQCAKDDPDNNLLCPIIAKTMAFDIDDKRYPGQWQYGADNMPLCTEFIEVAR